MNFEEQQDYEKAKGMGFTLENFIEDLRRIFELDCKSSVKVRRLQRIVDEAEKYAIECGQLPRKRPPKK